MRIIKGLKFILQSYRTIEDLISRIEELEEDMEILVNELGEMAAYCDKCDNDGSNCFKCNGSGIVKRKQLFGWQW